MKPNTGRGASWALLLGAAAGFSQIPDSIYSATDSVFRPMWNRTNLTADFWPTSNNFGILFPGTDTAVIRLNGQSRPSGQNWVNMNFVYRATPEQGNLEVRFQWRMLGSPSGNSGFNFRSYCQNGTIANQCNGTASGWRVNGPQFDLGPTYTGDIWNSGNARYAGTGVASDPPAIVTNTTACRAGYNTTTIQQWGSFSFVLLNDTAFTYRYIDGFGAAPTLCAKYFLTAATDKAATSQGFFSLQYETLVPSEFRSIVMRNITPNPVSIRSAAPRALPALVRAGPERSLMLDVRNPGPYALRVTDVRGAVIRSVRGEGPAVGRIVAVGAPGLYVTRVSSAGETTVRLVHVQ
jgi:hypothetical protein